MFLYLLNFCNNYFFLCTDNVSCGSRWLKAMSPSSMTLPTMSTWDAMFPTSQPSQQPGSQAPPLQGGQCPSAQSPMTAPSPAAMSAGMTGVTPSGGVLSPAPGSMGPNTPVSMGPGSNMGGPQMPNQPTGPGRPVTSPAGGKFFIQDYYRHLRN